jgi:hypothetical protein
MLLGSKLRALSGAERRLLDTVLIHKHRARVSPREPRPLAVCCFAKNAAGFFRASRSLQKGCRDFAKLPSALDCGPRVRVKICRKESTSFNNLRSLRSTVSEAHARNVWNRSRVIILTLPRLDLIPFLFQYPPSAVPDFGLVVDRNRRPDRARGIRHGTRRN